MKHPDYGGSQDEIVRLDIESKFEEQFELNKCCGIEPDRMFRSCKEYFIKCPICGRRTKMYRKMYMAIQAWNEGETE